MTSAQASSTPNTTNTSPPSTEQPSAAPTFSPRKEATKSKKRHRAGRSKAKKRRLPSSKSASVSESDYDSVRSRSCGSTGSGVEEPMEITQISQAEPIPNESIPTSPQPPIPEPSTSASLQKHFWRQLHSKPSLSSVAGRHGIGH